LEPAKRQRNESTKAPIAKTSGMMTLNLMANYSKCLVILMLYIVLWEEMKASSTLKFS
jgi:hypothetical protein